MKARNTQLGKFNLGWFGKKLSKSYDNCIHKSKFKAFQKEKSFGKIVSLVSEMSIKQILWAD